MTVSEIVPVTVPEIVPVTVPAIVRETGLDCSRDNCSRDLFQRRLRVYWWFTAARVCADTPRCNHFVRQFIGVIMIMRIWG